MDPCCWCCWVPMCKCELGTATKTKICYTNTWIHKKCNYKVYNEKEYETGIKKKKWPVVCSIGAIRVRILAYHWTFLFIYSSLIHCSCRTTLFSSTIFNGRGGSKANKATLGREMLKGRGSGTDNVNIHCPAISRQFFFIYHDCEYARWPFS